MHSTSIYFYYGPYLLVPASVLLWALGCKRHSFTLKGAALLAACALLVPAVATGSRMVLLPLLLGGVVLMYARQKRRPGPLAFGAGLLIAVIGSSVLMQTRDSRNTGRVSFAETTVQTISHPARALDPLTKQGDAEMVPAFAAALQIIPNDIPFKYGRAMASDLLTRPVPRQLWPAKPITPREQIIQHLWPREYALHIANPEFSVLLTLYLDFGAAGIAVGLGVLGILARALYEWFRKNEDTLKAQTVFALSLGIFVDSLRDSPVDSFTRFAFIVAPLLFVFRWARFSTAPTASRSPTAQARPSRPGSAVVTRT